MNENFGKGKREIADILKDCGVNPTTQRIEIAHMLLSEPQHISADEILKKINRDYEQVSQATVYNTLRLFVEKGVIRELIFSPDRIYYDSNTRPHHHFIDVNSGNIYDVPVESMPAPRIPGIAGLIQNMDITIRGRIASH